MSRTNANNPWLCRFAALTALATLALIGLGGLVTSHEAGMSVPDWPNTYGYNMFLFPVSKWVGGIFYEHTHRLLASAVGLLTVILAVWLWRAESRGGLRWLGVAAFLAVVLQGVLGGLRVVWFKDQIGIFHAALAQIFFVQVVVIALFTSRWWRNLPATESPRRLKKLFLATTLLIFAQLVLAATIRHQHAGLAISDFPRAHGQWWPDTGAAAVSGYNAARGEDSALKPITAFQIELQMAHRLAAAAILAAVAGCAWAARRHVRLAKISQAWLGLILAQAALGAWTIWSDKAADVATAHVVVGALALAGGALLTIIAGGISAPATAD